MAIYLNNNQQVDYIGLTIPSGRFKGKSIWGYIYGEIDASGSSLQQPVSIEFKLNKVYLYGGVHICRMKIPLDLYDANDDWTAEYMLDIGAGETVVIDPSKLDLEAGLPAGIYTFEYFHIYICEDVDEDIPVNQVIQVNTDTPILEIKIYDANGNPGVHLRLYPSFIYTSPIPYQVLSLNKLNKEFVIPFDTRNLAQLPTTYRYMYFATYIFATGYDQFRGDIVGTLRVFGDNDTLLAEQQLHPPKEGRWRPVWLWVYFSSRTVPFESIRKIQLSYNIPDDELEQISGYIHATIEIGHTDPEGYTDEDSGITMLDIVFNTPPVSIEVDQSMSISDEYSFETASAQRNIEVDASISLSDDYSVAPVGVVNITINTSIGLTDTYSIGQIPTRRIELNHYINVSDTYSYTMVSGRRIEVNTFMSLADSWVADPVPYRYIEIDTFMNLTDTYSLNAVPRRYIEIDMFISITDTYTTTDLGSQGIVIGGMYSYPWWSYFTGFASGIISKLMRKDLKTSKKKKE